MPKTPSSQLQGQRTPTSSSALTLPPESADAWEFSRQARVLSGKAHVGAFIRLAECMHEGDSGGSLPDVQWQIAGASDRDGRCRVHLSGSFGAVVGCMRCGEAVFEQLSFSRTLRLCKSEQEADQLETGDDEDAVAAPGRVNFREWLEDELLLCLPMFPSHAVCAAEAAVQYTDETGATAGGADEASDAALSKEQTPEGDSREPAETHRPFEALARLIGKPGKN